MAGRLSAGQLYAALDRLERDGLVASGGTGAASPHREFRITAGGAAELAAWLRTPPSLTAAPHHQFAAKVLAALRAPGVDVHEVVQMHRRALMELMRQWTRIKQQKAGNDLGLGLKIDAELCRLDSVIRWLDAADGRLANRVSDPDRERATVRLRDSFAEGRLTRKELDERITVALTARTASDLRRLTADLP